MSTKALSNREQETLLKQTKADALKKCDEFVKAFADCSRGRTISVAWACRGDHKAMQGCLRQYTSEEAMDKVRRDYLQHTRGQGASP
ncbi:hypothetical protein K437DRAFT_237726 [Tilletiaria anomala UBC 951]|uniref:COX assembly mitochondrial protein n=1 Tax=Tilletiaria anomala (strain ATCC 24038 / CBS 436.72 / UBC 951) TaxID=1037660 RepID=A0A066VUL6_TILAU|nr:uncharacterized protein K437DRAFT_237726 [Tilletiaria anomala UBC 951]KDN42504.1 hypothetical protein K437DRAFT_237726 [Tilletiaria anomala UBC 951]